jgi:hypothetical protein
VHLPASCNGSCTTNHRGSHLQLPISMTSLVQMLKRSQLFYGSIYLAITMQVMAMTPRPPVCMQVAEFPDEVSSLITTAPAYIGRTPRSKPAKVMMIYGVMIDAVKLISLPKTFCIRKNKSQMHTIVLQGLANL